MKAWGVCIFLMLINATNYADRALVAVLAEPIKVDLSLSDGQLGLLQGVAFAVVFSLFSIPMARWADRGFAKSIIICSVAIWSVMTVLGGLSQTFLVLVISRIGVAFGEAGLHPAAHRQLSTLFPAGRRGKAIALFSTGLPLGIAMGAYFGGWIGQDYGWRVAFLVIGPIGMLLIPFALLFLPRNKHLVATQPVSFLDDAKVLWALKPFRSLWLAFALTTCYGFALYSFFGPFFVRIHEFSTAQVGTYFAIMTGVGGLMGIVLGGYFHDAMAKRGPGDAMIPTAIATLASGCFGLIGWNTPSPVLAITFVSLSYLCYLLMYVPVLTVAQNLASETQRATSSAIMNIAGSLFGAVIGPLFAGLLSDAFVQSGGGDELRLSLSLMCALAFGASYCVYRAVSAFRIGNARAA